MEKWARANYQINLPLSENGQRVTACAEHIALARQAAAEGMVLLKNNHQILPLPFNSRVALFGKASFDYVQGGGGSGEVFSPYSGNLYDGFQQKREKVSIYEPLSDFYRKNVREQLSAGALPGLTQEPEIPTQLLCDAADFADTAVISICRFSGEGWDRKSVGATKADQLWDNIDAPALLAAKLFENGDFCLSQQEAAMVAAVTEKFSRVIVVLNVGGIIDSEWFKENEKIQGVLMAWAAGMEGGLAVADILTGDVNPSGKLADTFAKSLEDYPSTQSFHSAQEYVEYTEDIYVGYRYFETIAGCKEKVNYPFGYGLSYTQFSISPQGFTRRGECLEFWVAVKNQGEVSGKEVVQLYCSAPQGLLGKPLRSLVGFAKTEQLLPGETQQLKISVPLESLASFDDLGKIKKSAFVLEQGAYSFFVGNSVRDVRFIEQIYHCDENRVIEQCAPKLTPHQLPWRLLADGSREALPTFSNESLPKNMLEPLTQAQMECLTPVAREQKSRVFVHRFKQGATTLYDVAAGNVEPDKFLEQLQDDELACLLGGQSNTGVGITFGLGNLPEYGVPNVMTADGPAGVRIQPWVGIATTAWPCATSLACTWNEGLVAKVGEAGAKEMKENNLFVWLTPAINIHRSPLCGRNFEYYSEDPLLTGKLGAAMVRGIQSQQIAACVKHFAFNNKETNRKYSDSRVSERAAREIYLKAFELIVKEAQPWCIMSAYNLVNGCRCAENKELLEDVLRTEWGYEGLVMTDWWGYSEQYLEVLAGNDIKMGLGYPERLLEALEKGYLTRKDLLRSARRLLSLLLKLE